jgi:hypothetical protein
MKNNNSSDVYVRSYILDILLQKYLLLEGRYILLNSIICIFSYSLRMKAIAILMAAMLTVGTVLAVGLAVLPSSVHEAQANPCSVGTGSEGVSVSGSSSANDESEAETELFDCDFEGVVINEEVDGTIQ